MSKMRQDDTLSNGTTEEVVIDIEGCPDQIYTRFYVNGIAVLVDATPLDDPDIGAVVDLLLAAPDLLEALQNLLSLCESECNGVWIGDGAWEEAKDAHTVIAKAKPILNKA